MILNIVNHFIFY